MVPMLWQIKIEKTYFSIWFEINKLFDEKNKNIITFSMVELWTMLQLNILSFICQRMMMDVPFMHVP
jgi:hypothetical protein